MFLKLYPLLCGILTCRYLQCIRSVEDLTEVRIIGTGTFGRVTIVQLKERHRSFTDVTATTESPKASLVSPDAKRRRSTGGSLSKALSGRKRRSSAKFKPQVYAMKQLSKKSLLRFGQLDNFEREKRIMRMLDHPFLVKLVTS